MMYSTFDRRQLLRGAGLLAAGVALDPAVGCSSKRGNTGVISSGKAPLPAYVPVSTVRPDLPRIDPTGTCGYLKYPRRGFAAVSDAVLTSTKPVTAMVPISQAPTVGHAGNTILQLTEKRLGGRVNFLQITESDYLQRFNTTIAGGDLPDVMFFQPVASYADLLEAKFSDLTPYLSGDNIKQYPNLANIPTAIWEATTVGDRIYGLPQPRNGMSGLGLYHQEKYDKVGGYPKSADEYFTFLTELTRPNDKQWGMVANQGTAYNLAQFLQIFGVPFNWQVGRDGALTAAVESDGYRSALEFARKLFAAGVYHPNSNGPSQQMAALFDNGQAATSGTTVTGLLGAVKTESAVNKSFKPRALAAFSHDGTSRPVVYMDFVTKLFTVIAKTSKDRVREILRLADFAASPIGSAEYQLMEFGKEGVTFDFDRHGTPVVRSKFSQDGGPWGSIASGPMQFYDAQFPATVTARYDGTKSLSPYLTKDPTAGLYSATNARVGASLSQGLNDACTAIIAGHQPLSSFKQAVSKWRNGGGDKIRAEYEKALAHQ